MHPVPADETPTAETPVVPPAPPAVADAMTASTVLPPPTMQTLAQPVARTFAQPVLPPPPSAVPTALPTPESAPTAGIAPVSVAPVAAGTSDRADTSTSAGNSAPAVGEPAPTGSALVTGPAAILSADPAYAPLEQSLPALPTATPVKPAPPPSTHAPLTLEDLLGANNPNSTPTKKKQGSSVGRLFGRLVLLAVLVGGGYAAYTYGPDLYEQYVTGEPSEADPAEADAPLAFPNAGLAAAPIRTAEFILEGLPGAPEMSYRVTTDFETNVSQVDVTRPNGPDLQILTYGEAALIRRTDADQWYQLERGRFPLDDRLERTDWVRQLDELLPTSIRSSVTIDDAGETTVSGVPTRRLSLSLDVALLGSQSGNSEAPGDAQGTDAVPVDGAPPVDPAVPVDSAVPADPAAVPNPAAPTAAPPGAAAESEPTTSLVTSIEVWVDSEGLVRKVSGVPQLGAETITVIRTDSAAWVPNYPTPEFVQPLTAATLVELGI